MDKKIIDDIVWYIPFKKLRNALRIYLYTIANIDIVEDKANNNIIDTAPYYSKPIEDYYFIENRRKAGKEKRKSYDINDDKDIDFLINYQILHKLKEIELKNKVRNGQKIKVCFLLDEISKFYFDSVYKSMLNSDIFEPFILFTSNKNKLFKDNELFFNEYINDFNILKSNGYNVELGIDLNTSQIIPFEMFEIDILFYSCQYINYHNTELTNIFMNINYLTCHINYGLITLNLYDYYYNNKYINTAWKIFVQTKFDYYEYIDYSVHYGFNCVLSGDSKLDKYSNNLSEYKLPQKIDNGKPIIIYAPHHSIRFEFTLASLSTFHLYYKYFLNLVKSNPNINFVFKPHPNLFKRIIELGIFSEREYESYYEQWNSLDNGLCITDGDYIDLFRKSSLLITDCASFIGEYLPSGNPVIYLVNPERDQNTYFESFSNMGKKILVTYYLAHNEDEIQMYFDNIIENNVDPKKEERKKLSEEIFFNVGFAGKYITNYLEKILTN